jgi:hypothetical protein
VEKLNLELYKTHCDPTAEVYPLPAFYMILVVSSFWYVGENASVPSSEVKQCN